MAISKRQLDRACDRVEASEGREARDRRERREYRTRKLTEWMGAMPQFAPDAPPADWERQHAERPVLDRPVPRRASAHYYNRDLTSGGPTAYFY